MSNLTMDFAFGAQLKKLRIANDVGLRERARKLKMDAGNYSKLESGLHSPPKHVKGVYKLVKGFKYSQEQWVRLKMSAAAYHIIMLEAGIEAMKERFK